MNPELRRNLWLEITPHRLLAMPAVLALAFIAMSALDRSNAAAALSVAGLSGFGLLTVLWGSRLAAQSIVEEMVDKTWDWQRLSILGPWQMTWGKLFGATAFAWYGGLWCLGVFVATSASTSVLSDTPATTSASSPIKTALSAILLAVTLHAAAIAATLHLLKKGIAPHRRSAGVLVLVAVFSLFPFALSRGWESSSPVTWFGIAFDSGSFALASVATFAAWAVLGAYRSMCHGLAVRTAPVVWLGFLVFVSFYSAGFAVGKPGVGFASALLFSGLVWSGSLFYLMLFSEPTGPLEVRRVARRIGLGQWRRAAQELPCWPVTLGVAALCALPLAILNTSSSALPTGWALVPIPLVLMLARDAGILMFFLAAPRPKRAEGTTLVYILVLDWILPSMLGAMGLDGLAGLILPLGGANPWLQFAVALFQAAVAIGLAWRRIAQRLAATRRADGA